MKGQIHKSLGLVMAGLLLGILVVGCGPTPAPESPSTPAMATQLKVAVVMPGPVDDAAWNAAAYEGLKLVEKELGAKTAYSDKVTKPDFEQTFRSYASEGYDLIIGHGWEFGETILAVAPDYPNSHFAVVEGSFTGDNVASMLINHEDAGYMVGAVAAHLTESGEIGFIGGMEIPSVTAQIYGIEQALEAYSPNSELQIAYLGTWADVGKGKEAAAAQASMGVDIVTHVADAGGVGMAEAAKEHDIWAIGWPSDQSSLAPENFATSVTLAVGPMILDMAKRVQDGTFEGTVLTYGIKEGALQYAPFNSAVPKDVQDKAMAAYDDVKSGKVEVKTLER